MKFYKEQFTATSTATSTDFVAFDENGVDGITVTHWDGWGYREIRKCVIFDDCAGVQITQEEFMEHFGKAHAELLFAANLFADLQIAPFVEESRALYEIAQQEGKRQLEAINEIRKGFDT